jgi:crotonobetainyl-CoA:carnitine CoA-transferase CaiB-like acyl-CoA transferase
MSHNSWEPSVQPLTGVRIIDFSTLLPGPLATLTLAAAGAEVIKIEPPGGDPMSGLGGKLPSGEGAAYALLRHGKRTVTLNLRQSRDLQTARDLVATADVLVEQNRPGVMHRLGLGYEEISRSHPRVIYCSISGYGQTGSHANRAGHDLNYMAQAGLLANVMGASGAPPLPATQIADIGGGALPAVINVLLALRQREQTARGCHLDIAMSDGLLAFQTLTFADALAHGKAPAPNSHLLTGASPRYRVYETRDARWLAVAAIEEKFWQVFCEVICLSAEYRDDTRDPDGTVKAVAASLRRETAAHWLERFGDRDACVTLVRSFDEALMQQQIDFSDAAAWRAAVVDRSQPLPRLPVPIAAQFRREALHGPLGGRDGSKRFLASCTD